MHIYSCIYLNIDMLFCVLPPQVTMELNEPKHHQYKHIYIFEYTYAVLSPSSLRALLSICGRCSFGGLGCCSCRVRVCRCRGCCSLSVCVCVCVCV